MPGKWDNNMKRLIQISPQTFINWLLKGAIIVQELSVEINRDISIDSAYEIFYNGEYIIVHIEFQRFDAKTMARRVLEYSVYLTCKYGRPVMSFVIYMKEEGTIVESPLISQLCDGHEIWHFNFTNVPLWEVSTDMLRDVDGIGILPLLPLTREGNRPEVIDEVLERIKQSSVEPGLKENLLTITFTLARLALDKPEHVDWLRKRFYMYQDLIRDTEIYQIILQEGVEQEKQREVQRIEQGILSLVQKRFSELMNEAEMCVKAISDVLLLHQLFLDIAQAKTVEEARVILANAQPGEKH